MEYIDTLERNIRSLPRRFGEHGVIDIHPDVKQLANALIVIARELESENRKLKGQILRMKRKYRA